MKTLTTLLQTSLLLAYAVSVPAAGKLRVIDKGMDGDTRHYQIVCPNGERTGVLRKFDIPESSESSRDPKDWARLGDPVGYVPPTKLLNTCAISKDGKRQCRQNWSVDDAARAACSQ